MAQKKKVKKIKEKRGSTESKDSWYDGLKEETKHSIFAVISLVFAVFFTLSAFGNAGVIGKSIYNIFETLFGAGFFLLPVVFFLAAILLLSSVRPNFLSHTLIGGILFLVSGLGIIDIVLQNKGGGLVGYFVSWPLLRLFDFWLSFIILMALFIISFLIMLNTAISIKITRKKKKEKEEDKKEEEDEEDDEIEEDEKKEKKDKETIKTILPKKQEKKDKEEMVIETKKVKHADFTPPPLELLSEDKGKPSSGDIKANANIIKRTLQNFGIEVEMGEINIGPSVTQYTLKPAEGIKLSRIIGLQNDLALAMAAHPLRLEAPIPGRSLVGVEAPNNTKTIVGLARLFAEPNFVTSGKPLLLALGRDVTGTPVYADLAKMPHMLIAGATGAGKSICIHVLITSLLYKNSPESLRFIMIDPKRVELTGYNKIPHLLTPVITKPKMAILALKWGCKEMDRRYEELLKAGVRDIESYHKKYGGYNSMPYLIIIIDELADMMSSYPREMESAIVRLAQMSRAVGIHLVVSTQRPSVEVITGLIKANIPCRVALQVASQVDSRTILDMSGAEKLLGSGDMLFLAGNTSKPRRIQGPFISEKEVERVVDYLEEEYKDIDIEGQEILEEKEEGAKSQSSFSLSGIDLEEMEKNDDDDLYEDAKKAVMEADRASTSYLQRKLKVGYARAARLMDMLEERGVIGPGDGAKAREVLIGSNQAIGNEADFLSTDNTEEREQDEDSEDKPIEETGESEENF